MKVLSASLRLCVLILCVLSAVAGQIRDFTSHVNPFIGTGGHGHTFPGATMPFGMVQLSPDTRIDNWDGSSGYHYSDDIIYGFSHTHLSGTGIPDGCDILFMPTTGEYVSYPTRNIHMGFRGYPSTFSHSTEKAEPGYYTVKIDDDKLSVELTATARVGLHRYTFPRSEKSAVDLNLDWRDKLLSSDINIVGNTRVEGSRRSSSWAKNQEIFFAAEFSKPFANVLQEKKRRGAVFQFATHQGEQILLKVAISHVSIEGARKNLEAELPGWDFDKVRTDAKAAWNKELSKIEVSGGTPEQTTNFYTALYHTMIQPNVFNDVDGRYKGHDGKVHSLPGYEMQKAARVSSPTVRKGSPSLTAQHGSPPRPRNAATPPKTGGELQNHYTVFSLWDTFRAAHPLYTIIDQKRTVDFINTFIRIYEQGGRLPVWELWGEETDTMIGYHAVSVIADAMAKGIKGFDYEKAYAAAKHSAELDHFGLAAYKKRGYISMEDENESVSKTLEYAYNDWCIAQMAKMLAGGSPVNVVDGKLLSNKSPYVSDYFKYLLRSSSFQNLFDPVTGFMRPKKNGGFIEPFAPNEVTFGFTEGNSWQYSFFVPQDVPGLMHLHGGRLGFGKKLEELFTTDQKLAGREQADLTGLIGQYAHGNEPSHHIPYLFNYADDPAKTQKYVRKIMNDFYRNTPNGLIGNEDCGQMSAWYVLSSLGFYPVTPGSPQYELGTPLFKHAKINLENGRSFTIRAPRVSDERIYVRSMRLNGKKVVWTTILKHADIIKGGLLEFEMSAVPMSFGYPYNLFHRHRSLLNHASAVPVISAAEKSFSTRTAITISSITPVSSIFYTLDGSEPTNLSTKYSGPIAIDKETLVKAITVNAASTSPAAEARFRKRPNDWIVKVISGYSTQYTGGGDNAIVDGIRGTVNFASGEWQGVQGKPYEAVIDLRRETEIKQLGGSFLQVALPWIWMPDRVEFEVSSDGTNFMLVAEIKPDFPQREMTPTVKELTQVITPTKARYVRVKAYNFGKIPAWHLGAGGDPWIFIDEIIVR